MNQDPKRLKWMLLLEGTVMMVAGVVMALLPLQFVKAISLTIGIGLLVLGALGIFRTLQSRYGSGVRVAPSYVGPILALLVGLLLVFNPLSLPKLVVLILGVFLLVLGVLQFLAGMVFGHNARSASIKIAGILSIVLGIVVMLFPAAAIWLFALFVGANLLCNGAITFMAGWRMRSSYTPGT